MLRYLFPILLLFFASPVNAGDLLQDEVAAKGKNRQFLIYLPEIHKKLNYDQKIPLVIGLHGNGSSGKIFMEATNMNQFAEKHGFIAAYPDGSMNLYNQKNIFTWKPFDCCGLHNLKKKRLNDIEMLEELIDYMIEEYNADEKRIYIVGHSKGARLAYLSACLLSEKITAIGANAVNIPDYIILGQCETKVPFMHTHGAQDKCIPFLTEGECGGCMTKSFTYNGTEFLKNASDAYCYPISKSYDAAARSYKCREKEDFTIGENIFCRVQKDCDDKSRASICAFTNSGHSWPGSNEPEVCASSGNNGARSHICKKFKDIMGEINKDINVMDLYWGFFKTILKDEKNN